MSKPVDLSAVAAKWPPLIPRESVETVTAGLVASHTLANHDCAGTGPKRLRIGRKIVYRAEDLAAWLAAQATELA